MPIGAPRSQIRGGAGGRVKRILAPMGCTHLRCAGRRGRAPGPALSPSRPPCRPWPAFPFPPEIPVPPCQHRGWIRLRMGGYNSRMWGPGNAEGGGKVTVNTNSSAVLRQWEPPATVAAPADSRVGDTSS